MKTVGLLIALSMALGLPGAALAVLFSSILTMFVDLQFLVRHVVAISLWHFAIAPLVSASAVAVALVLTDGAAFWLRALVAVGTWAVAVASFRVLPREELAFIRQLVMPVRVKTGEGT